MDTTNGHSKDAARPSRDSSLNIAERREHLAQAEFLNKALRDSGDLARTVVDIFEAASDLIEKVDTLLVRQALKSGFDRERVFESFGEHRFAEFISEITLEAERLVTIYFHSKDNAQKCEAVIATVREFIDLMKAAQQEGQIPLELLAKDAFKVIAQNITALALQDKGREITTIVELDAAHLTEHDIARCMQLADQWSQNGHSLSAMERLLIHQSIIYHKVGYMVPPILEAVAERGINGRELGIPMLAARYVRSQYEDSKSAWKNLFSEQAFEALHRAILYQGDTLQNDYAKAEPDGIAQILRTRIQSA